MTRPMRSVCPYCRHRHDLVSAVVPKGESQRLTEEPRPGTDDSYSFCIGCGEVAVFDLSLPGKLRFPSFEEAMEASTDRRILDLTLAWHRSVELLHNKPRPIQHRPEWMQ